MKRLLRIAIPALLLSYAKPVDFQTEFQAESPCRFCILQQDGRLGNIIYRAVTGNYAEEANLTFGHCFVCIHCPDADTPACYGWWPQDPEGGDYEGDEGSLHPDAKEPWHNADCIGITAKRADELMSVLDHYEESHRYQVLNNGGTSCTGFCNEMTEHAGATLNLPYGYLTVAGNMSIKGSSLRVRNAAGSTTLDLMKQVQHGTYPLSNGYLWLRNDLPNEQ
ncbi:MAG: hypothetical protein VX278_22450 [Myxococcota bacterium]|nr:hypothetical protein [Myxococcota bacterium]